MSEGGVSGPNLVDESSVIPQTRIWSSQKLRVAIKHCRVIQIR